MSLTRVFNGSPPALLEVDDAVTRLEQAGLERVRELERTWNQPLCLVIGERA